MPCITSRRSDITRSALHAQFDIILVTHCFVQSCAGLESDNAQLKTDLTAAQAEMSKTSTANASSLDQQQQQQVHLANIVFTGCHGRFLHPHLCDANTSLASR